MYQTCAGAAQLAAFGAPRDLVDELVAVVRWYYARDRSPLRRFSARVDAAYLDQHPEALRAIARYHLSLAPEERYAVSSRVEDHLRLLAGNR